MNQQEFQQRYAEMTGLAWVHLEKYLEAVPCRCNKKACPGWQMITLPNELPPLQVPVARTLFSRRSLGRQHSEPRVPSLAQV